jgi:FkbM family methyltransferase
VGEATLDGLRDLKRDKAMVKIISMTRSIASWVLPLHRAMPPLTYFKALRAPSFEVTQTNLFGKPFWFSDRDGFFHSYREIFKTKAYAFESSSSKPLIIDAGANIGLSVIFFKRLFPHSKIIAFEPDPDIYNLLEKNVAAQGYTDVDLRRSAVWIRDEDLTFYSEGSLSGSTEVDFLSLGHAKTVNAKRLKSLLQKLGKIDFLKIDIEGAEALVLRDIESEITNVDNLFFEYHSIPGKPQELGDLLSIITKAGFRYVIDGTYGPYSPFLRSALGTYDNQINVSCFRRS